MNRLLVITCLLLMAVASQAQRITYSEPQREDNRDINFDIIGKLENNILVFKNAKWKYAIAVYDGNDMMLKEKVDLDFIPDKAYNVEYIAYPDNFWLIYQYQRRGVVYCMGAKMNSKGHLVDEPVQLDTTHVGTFGDNKIYSTIHSEDKKQIMIFKILKKNVKFNFVTLLLNSRLQLLHRSRIDMEYDDRDDVLSDFFVDNEGNFIFSKAVKSGSRANLSSLYLYTKAALQDTFKAKQINLKDFFIDEVKMKVDNVNKRYLLNSFYYSERRGNIEGIFSAVWDVPGDSTNLIVFTRLDDSVRNVAKAKGNIKQALNNFFIRHILLKRDGSFLIAAEDYSSQSSGNMGWNRWDYMYGSPFMSPYDYYFYRPYYGGFYRPYNRFNSGQNTRYYYDNILLLDMTKDGRVSWNKIIHKEQFADDNDNYLSFSTFITEAQIHFLFNLIEKRDKLLTDNTLSADGTLKRNPTIKSVERGYEFMPKLAKQVGARQIIIPCTFRNQISFAKVDF